MSYDLAFWKQTAACTEIPSKVYADLLDGQIVAGLETIPAAEFLTRLHRNFPGIITEGGLTYWEGGDRGMFEVHSSNQHVHLCCREMSGDDMNTFIDIATEFGCPLYDPQEDTRYVAPGA